MRVYLGIDVGGTKIAAGLVNELGQVEGYSKVPTLQDSDQSALEQLQKVIASFDLGRIEGVGIGIPGIADQRKGTVWAPNIRGWDQLPLSSLLLERFPELAFAVESDRNTAVLAELLYGAGRGRRDVIALIIGTGIGAGIVSGRHLVRGQSEIGGAVGWIPVTFRQEMHHFEEVAAGPAIERLGSDLGLVGDLATISRRARQGDVTAKGLLEEVGVVIGQALSVLVSTFNPEVIVIEGGVSHIWDLLKDPAGRAMVEWSQPLSVKEVEVVASQLGEVAGVLGAAAAVRGLNGGEL